MEKRLKKAFNRFSSHTWSRAQGKEPASSTGTNYDIPRQQIRPSETAISREQEVSREISLIDSDSERGLSIYDRGLVFDLYGALISSTQPILDPQPTTWTLPLPQDIVYDIIDTYFFNIHPEPDLVSLYNLARTSRCLTAYCRSVIYRTITILPDRHGDGTLAELFARLLSASPEILHYVHTLRIIDTGSMFQHSVPLPEVEQSLRYIVSQEYPNLQRVELSIPVMWMLLPNSLQYAFEVCFQAKTLREVAILRGRIPASFFQHLRSIPSLDVRAFVSFPSEPFPHPDNLCVPETLTILDNTHEGESLANILHENCPLRLDRVTDLHIHANEKNLSLLKPVFMARSSALTNLTIHNLGVKLYTQLSLKNLKSLKSLTLIANLRHSIMLPWIVSVLSTCHSNLEYLTVVVPYYQTSENSNSKEVWKPINNLFTDTHWPKLRRFNLQLSANLLQRQLPLDEHTINIERFTDALPNVAVSTNLLVEVTRDSDYPSS